MSRALHLWDLPLAKVLEWSFLASGSMESQTNTLSYLQAFFYASQYACGTGGSKVAPSLLSPTGMWWTGRWRPNTMLWIRAVPYRTWAHTSNKLCSEHEVNLGVEILSLYRNLPPHTLRTVLLAFEWAWTTLVASYGNIKHKWLDVSWSSCTYAPKIFVWLLPGRFHDFPRHGPWWLSILAIEFQLRKR